jgi:hypothetical protein
MKKSVAGSPVYCENFLVLVAQADVSQKNDPLKTGVIFSGRCNSALRVSARP